MSMNLEIKSLVDSDIEDVIKNPIYTEILEYGEIDLKGVNVFEKYGIHETKINQFSSWKPKAQCEVLKLYGQFIPLNYILTGDIFGNNNIYPLNFLEANYRPVTTFGWGYLNVYFSREVKDIVDSIESLNKTLLYDKYNPNDFNEKKNLRGYTFVQDDIKELLESLESMKDFLKITYQNGKGIYIIIE